MEQQKSKVFILVDNGHDYSAAKDWGDIIMLGLSPSISYDLPRIYAELKEKMDCAEKDDYILVSGPVTFCCVATSLMTEWFGQVRYLLYSDGKYLSRSIVHNPEV